MMLFFGEKTIFQNNPQKARIYFQSLIKKHPKSLLVKDAKVKLAKIPPLKIKTAKIKKSKKKNEIFKNNYQS